jgi:putative peptidoglycan lipid II flippase
MPKAASSGAKPGSSLMRSSLVYSSLTLVSRFMGLARDLVITARIGASATIAGDAYATALAFPNLFRRIFAEGAFAAAFVPAYSKSLTEDGEEIADRLAADAMASLAAATIILTIAAQLAMPWLMILMNPGYVSDPEKFKLSVVLTQLAMPYLPCMAITAHLSGVLNARGRFGLSAAAPTLLNLIMLIFVLPQHEAHAAARWAVYGVVVSGLAQAALLTWGVTKSGAKVHWRLPRLTPEIKKLLALAVPGAIAASATQINIFISGNLVSSVNGARNWLNVADRLYQLPLGLVGVAIGVALLPRLSRAVHSGDLKDAQSAMDEAIALALAFCLPAAAALVAMPFFLIDALFTRGLFTSFDSVETAKTLLQYGWGVPAFVLTRILSPAFFARQDTKGPMTFALASVTVNVVLGIALFQVVGVQGIAAATSAAAWLNVGLMMGALARRGTYRPSAAAWSRIFRIGLASLAAGLVMAAASHWRPLVEAPFQFIHLSIGGAKAFGAKEVAVLLVVAVAAVLYPLFLFAFGGLTLTEVKAALRRPARAAADPIPPLDLG